MAICKKTTDLVVLRCNIRVRECHTSIETCLNRLRVRC
nr:MAG TPA: hypothetical protein [Caudoviricetes sp.]